MSPDSAKFLLIGDPHFKPTNCLETSQLYVETEKLLKREQYDLVVVLGDVLDTFDRIHLPTFKRCEKYLEMINSHTRLAVLIGNHDRVNNGEFLSDVHAFGSLEHWKSPRGEPAIIAGNVKLLNISGMNFIFAPYVPPNRFLEALNSLENLDFSNIRAVFSHQEYRGAKMGAIVSQIEEGWPEDYPLNFSGHIHDYDELQRNLIYVGTPFQHGFTDSSNRGVLKVVFSKENYSFERISLGIWRKVTKNFSVKQFKKFVPKENKIYNINLSGEITAINSLLSRSRIKELLARETIKLKIKNIALESSLGINEEKEEEVYGEKEGNTSFINILYNCIKDNIEMIETLKKII